MTFSLTHHNRWQKSRFTQLMVPLAPNQHKQPHIQCRLGNHKTPNGAARPVESRSAKESRFRGEQRSKAVEVWEQEKMWKSCASRRRKGWWFQSPRSQREDVLLIFRMRIETLLNNYKSNWWSRMNETKDFAKKRSGSWNVNLYCALKAIFAINPVDYHQPSILRRGLWDATKTAPHTTTM